MRKQPSIFGEQQSPGRRLMRRFALAQVAVQFGVILTPFYAATVLASTSAPVGNPLFDGAAQHASGLAQSRNAEGYFTQHATSMASGQMQQWLEQFGTARVELGADNKFKTHSGSVDLLFPLYRNEDHIIFAQPGLRTLDSQVTGNFGLGHRHFIDDWMLGYNAFYDHNISRGHKRLGLGGEVWRDYLKLSMNGYYRLSDWKASRDIAEYEARPANGFDLRAEGWLPDWPAIGGKLMYEKYYGNEVSLGSRDNRQKDPSAFTGGISYTPFPLLTFTSDHKAGSGISDTRFGMQINYQLGVPVEKQLDATSVGDRRTLAGSAMDLVERNNNIVLEYRQQESFVLILPSSISGASGGTQSIDFTLKSRHGLNRIVWNDEELQAAGGKVEALSTDSYQLTLPLYAYSGKNQYILSGVAYDQRNVASAMASTQIIVQEPGVDSRASSIIAADRALVADGRSSTQMTATLVAKDGQPLRNMEKSLQIRLLQASVAAGEQEAKLGEVREISAGRYQFSVTAGTLVGELTVEATLFNTPLNTVTIDQIADNGLPNISDSDLIVLKDNVVADGISTAEIRARVTHDDGSPVENHTVTFTLTGSAQVAPGSALTGNTDTHGYINLSLVNTKAEAITVLASTGEGKNTRKEVQFIADTTTAEVVKGSVVPDKLRAVADGVDGIQYTARVTDAKGNPVPNQRVTWLTTAGTLNSTFSNSDRNGEVSVTLSNRNTGRAVVSAQLNAKIDAEQVLFTGDATTARVVSLSESKAVMTGSEGDLNVITAVVKDAQGRFIEGQVVTWSATSGGRVERSSVTNDRGEATATLYAKNTSKVKIQVSVIADTNLTSESRTVTARPVYAVGNRYYWTMYSEYKTVEEVLANSECRAYGGGRAANLDDLAYFAAQKANFGEMQSQSNNGTLEFSKPLYQMYGTRSGSYVTMGNFRTTLFTDGITRQPGYHFNVHSNSPTNNFVCVRD